MARCFAEGEKRAGHRQVEYAEEYGRIVKTATNLLSGKVRNVVKYLSRGEGTVEKNAG